MTSPTSHGGPGAGSRRRGPGRRFVAVCLLVTGAALALRLFLAIGLPNDEPGDARVYSLIAENIVRHGTLSVDPSPPILPTYIRMPGYPVLLAAVYSLLGPGADGAVRVLQALADTATCWLVALLAMAWSPPRWDHFRRRRALLWGLVLASACPFTVFYLATLLTETWAFLLGTATVLAAVLAARAATEARARWLWSAAGVCAGLATLFRPDCGLLAAAAGGLLAALVLGQLGHSLRAVPGRRSTEEARRIMRLGFFRGLALTAGFAAAMAPWVVRNAVTFQSLRLLAPPAANMPWENVSVGYDRWMRTWVDDQRYIDEFNWELDTNRMNVEHLPAGAFDTPEERERVAALFERYNHPAPKSGVTAKPGAAYPRPPFMSPKLDAAFDALARERIARDPVRCRLILPVKRVVSMWFDAHSQYSPYEDEIFPLKHLADDPATLAWLVLLMALVWFYTLAGAAGCWVWWRQEECRKWLLLMALLIVPRLVLLAPLSNPEPRYVAEFFPWLAATGAVAMAAVPGWSGRRARSANEVPQ